MLSSLVLALLFALFVTALLLSLSTLNISMAAGCFLVCFGLLWRLPPTRPIARWTMLVFGADPFVLAFLAYARGVFGIEHYAPSID